VVSLLVAVAVPLLSGCEIGLDTLDLSTVRNARAGFQEHFEKYPVGAKRHTEEVGASKGGSLGDVIVGELIAIFPGFFVHGLGHYYAKDYQTSRQLRSIGEIGWLFSAIGGGLIVGGYYLDENDDDKWQGTVYSLYGSGSFFGLVGVGYLMVAWFYDMIDTPRAVETGGEPPPRSRFVESLDFFR